MDAAKKIILLLALVVACALPASALTPSAPENRVWEKINGTLETHQETALQVPQSHQEEAGATAETVSECFLAAKGAGEMVTVTHFTGAEGAAAIGEGGSLNAGSFVTTSNLSGMSAGEVEATLEINSSR